MTNSISHHAYQSYLQNQNNLLVFRNLFYNFDFYQFEGMILIAPLRHVGIFILMRHWLITIDDILLKLLPCLLQQILTMLVIIEIKPAER